MKGCVELADWQYLSGEWVLIVRTVGDKQVNVHKMQIGTTTMTTVLRVNHPTSHRNV